MGRGGVRWQLSAQVFPQVEGICIASHLGEIVKEGRGRDDRTEITVVSPLRKIGFSADWGSRSGGSIIW